MGIFKNIVDRFFKKASIDKIEENLEIKGRENVISQHVCQNITKESSDVCDGMEFVATCQLRTPLFVLKKNGEIFRGEGTPPTYGEARDGVWLPKLNDKFFLVPTLQRGNAYRYFRRTPYLLTVVVCIPTEDRGNEGENILCSCHITNKDRLRSAAIYPYSLEAILRVDIKELFVGLLMFWRRSVSEGSRLVRDPTTVHFSALELSAGKRPSAPLNGEPTYGL